MDRILPRLQAGLAGRYEVEREIGLGGMAVVYAARDLKHDRRVALKVLRPELVAAIGADRFLREIRVTANLQHPHVLPLHDSGDVDGLLFYVMPLVAGETLRARLQRLKQLPLSEAVEFTRQIAGALDHAHRHGVVHRDVKPENVLIHDGQALLTDFGIALAASQPDVAARLTETGLSIGTPQYMSPEQATGEKTVDARTDVYATGCMLYEMLAGDPPFTASTAQAITARKLTGAVPSLRPVRESVSAALDRVVARSLARVPADRYESMATFLDDINRAVADPARYSRRRLWRSAAVALLAAAVAGGLWASRDVGRTWFAGAPDYARVAVLPLENGTGDSSQNYLVDGLTEAVIADLARMERVDVISFTSVQEYRGASGSANDIARTLGIDAVVDGSVARTGRGVRVHVRLSSLSGAARDTLTLERPFSELVALQRDVAEGLAKEIGGRIARSRVVTANAAAHDLYLRGRYHLNIRTPEGLQNGLDYFRQALAVDPAYALAHAGLAQYYSILPFYTNTLPAEAFGKAKAAAQRAVELDPFLPEAHAALGYVLAFGEWDWIGAEQAYRRALALRRSDANVHHALSRLLAARGRLQEAVVAAQRSHQLDPLSLVAHANIGVIAYFGRDYPEATRRMMATLQIDSQFPVAHWGLGLVQEQLGAYDKAIAHFEDAMRIAGRGTNTLASLGHALARAGRRAEAERVLEEVIQRARNRPVLGYEVAIVQAGLGRTEDALASLEQAYREGSTLISYLDRDPRLDPLRSSPRFAALRDKLRLSGTGAAQ